MILKNNRAKCGCSERAPQENGFRVFLLQWFPSSHQVKDRCVSDTFFFHWYFFNAFLSGLNILKCPIDKNILYNKNFKEYVCVPVVI